MRIYPEQKYVKKVEDFKKQILSNIEQNLNNYQIFKIKHKDTFDFILKKIQSMTTF